MLLRKIDIIISFQHRSRVNIILPTKAGGPVMIFLSFCHSFVLSVTRITHERVKGR